MPWCVNQVENISFAVLSSIVEFNRIELNGNAPLPLQIHAIQKLSLHFSAGDRLRCFQDSICQSRLTVINMRNNGEIPNLLLPFF